MSTAIPGEEASSQTMCELSFDNSNEDEDGEADDSQDHLSAEEDYETANDRLPEPLPAAPAEELSTTAEPEPKCLLQLNVHPPRSASSQLPKLRLSHA
jgi:hypothetical protein